MSRSVALLIAAAFAAAAAAQTPSAADLLARVDAHEIFTTISYTGRMVIEHQGRRFVKTFEAYGRGTAESFVEFTNPEDRGTRYLRTGGRLYVYSPDTEEVMLISGHMLRESMMGSDLSYEDTLDNEKLSVRYVPVISGREQVGGRDAWVLDLTARRRTESYPRRTLWVDVETGDVLRYELFALSGARLKEYILIRAETIGGRRFPVESEMRDLLRRGSRTVFVISDLVLDGRIPDHIFSLRNLKR